MKGFPFIPLQSLGGFQPELVGIELGAAAVKMVRMKSGARKEVAAVSSREIKGLADDKVAEALGAAFRELKAHEPRVALVIPSPILITKNIEVPSVDSRELREIVNLQAARHTPFSREEIIVDYIEIGTFKQNYTKILLLIVTAAAVKKQIALAEKAGIAVDKVLLCQEGIGFFCARTLRNEGSLPVGFIHVDELSTDFSVVLRQKVLFVRSIPIGRQQLATDAEKTLPKFYEEIKKSLETYHTENIEKDPQALFIAGAVAEMADLDLALAAQTRLSVKRLAYWNSFTLDPAVAAAGEAVSFLDVAAPLASFAECKVNLLPEEIRLKRALRERGMDLFLGGILLLAMLVLMLFISVSRIYFKSEYLKALETRYKALAEDTRKLEKTYQQNSLIRGYLSSRGYSLKVLSELHEVTPVSMELGDIRFDREGKFTIRGTADSMATVFAFVDALEKAKYFKDVKTKYTTKRQEGRRDVTDFEINALLSKTVTE